MNRPASPQPFADWILDNQPVRQDVQIYGRQIVWRYAYCMISHGVILLYDFGVDDCDFREWIAYLESCEHVVRIHKGKPSWSTETMIHRSGLGVDREQSRKPSGLKSGSKKLRRITSESESFDWSSSGIE